MKTEIRILLPTTTSLVSNGTFNDYTTAWLTGATVTSDAIYPPIYLSANTTTSYDSIVNPSGWTWSNNTMISQENSTLPLQQNIDGVQESLVYNVKFSVKGYVETGMSSGETVTVSLYGNDATTIVNQDGNYNLDIPITTYSAANTSLIFTPTSGFVGGITNVNINPTSITNQKLDLYDDETYNLTFQIQTSISDKGSSYSKTIRIPGTSNNNVIFNNLMDIGRYIDPDTIGDNKVIFINKKIRAGIYSDSVELLIGYLEVEKVINKNKYIEEYECVFYSNIRSIADAIGEKVCVGNIDSNDDLDFSNYNHKHNFANMQATWNTSSSGYTQAKGIFYPVIDYANISTGNVYRLENFKPCLYVKEIWDRIFQDAGFTYTSSFLNSTRFKSLVIPVSNTLEESKLYFANSKFKIGVNTEYLTPVQWQPNANNGLLWSKIKFDKFSGGTMFNGANGVVPFKPTTCSTPNCVGNEWLVTSSGSGVYNLQAFVNYNIFFPSGAGYGWFQTTTSSTIKVYARLMRKRGNFTEILAQSTNEHTEGSGYIVTPPRNILSATTAIEVGASSIQCIEGDRYYVEMTIDSINYVWQEGIVAPGAGTGFIKNARQLRIYASGNEMNIYSTFYNEPDNKLNYYLENSMVFANDILPRKMKQIDFIKSISNKFNLMFAENKAITDDLLIEPYDDFYLTGRTNTFDWTWKVDTSIENTFERAPQLLNKDFSITFKDDANDALLDKYSSVYSSNFGDRLIRNKYLSDGTEKIEDVFSSTFLGKLGTTNWIVSKIYGEKDTYNKFPTDSEYNYRVLYRNVLTQSNTGGVQPSPVLITSYDNTSGTTTASGITIYQERVVGSLNYTYPYAGFLDNPYVPTFDLNYGLANYYLHPNATWTYNNLLETYWLKKLALYLDINSKLLTCYIRLNNTDIAQLDFRKQIFINNHLYRLQRIIEWNPNGSSKVELIMVQPLNRNAYVPQQTVVNANFTSGGGTGTLGNGTTIGIIQPPPAYLNLQTTQPTVSLAFDLPNGVGNETDFSGTTIAANENQISKVATGIVIGANNYIAEDNFFVKGQSNYVASKNVSLIDSSFNNIQSDGAILMGSNYNTILSGATGVFLINTSGITVSESGGTYINGQDVSTSGISGSSGTSGTNGTSGTDGTSGTSGTNGTSGSSGTDGVGGTYKEGEFAQGGIIVKHWYDGVWENALIMSLDNLSTGYTFSNVSTSLSAATSQWDGYMNTYYITLQSGHTTSAAQLCFDYSGGSTADWYLPSNYDMIAIEGNTMMLNWNLLNNGYDPLLGMAYWTSTDAGGGNAFQGNVQYNYNNSATKSTLNAVRAVRMWTNTP